MMKVLVTYATAHGSTAEVGAEIGRILSEKGLVVEVVNVKEVRTVDGYDALVIGSAVHNGAWLPEFNAFLKAFADKLERVPVYLWLSCIRVLEQYGEQHVKEYYINYGLLEKLNVQDVAVFPGKLDLAASDWNERWTLAARYDGATWPSSFDGDFRDWDKIRAWANQVAAWLVPQKAAAR
jgi:menaquinone-dependent protoporphyrinogen oxidase